MIMRLVVLSALLAIVSAGPAVVQPTPGFNPSANGVYSTTARNPNPDVTVQWYFPPFPVPKAAVPAVEAALIPGTDDMFLYVGRYIKTKGTLPYKEYLAATFNLKTGAMKNISSDSDLFCGHICPTSDGKLLLVGGSDKLETGFVSGLNHVRLWDYHGPNAGRLAKTATMNVGRWYPSVTLLPDKSILIQGGTTQAREEGPRSFVMDRWIPSKPNMSPMTAIGIETVYKEKMGKNMFPGQFVLGTGDVYIQQDNLIRFLMPNGKYRTVNGVPAFPGNIATQWPRSGTLVMGPLTSNDGFTSTEIIVMGGTPRDAPCTHGPPANAVVAIRKVYSLKITWSTVGGNVKYTFPDGKWNVEDMGIPRTGGDGTLTAFGDIILTSGSQRGCHGQPAPDAWVGATRNSYPALWPILYQTDRQVGKRVTVMQASTIPRVYHNVASLTRDGHIMVAGCDACNPSTAFIAGLDPKTAGWRSLSKTGRREFRTEILKHPFSLDADNRPDIVAVNNNGNGNAVVKVGYGDLITINWAPHKAGQGTRVTRVTLVAPTSATHGYNTNQRVLKLETVSNEGGKLVVKMPPNAKVAPPQMYLLFLMNKKSNSRSRWVHLQ